MKSGIVGFKDGFPIFIDSEEKTQIPFVKDSMKKCYNRIGATVKVIVQPMFPDGNKMAFIQSFATGTPETRVVGSISDEKLAALLNKKRNAFTEDQRIIIADIALACYEAGETGQNYFTTFYKISKKYGI